VIHFYSYPKISPSKRKDETNKKKLSLQNSLKLDKFLVMIARKSKTVRMKESSF